VPGYGKYYKISLVHTYTIISTDTINRMTDRATYSTLGEIVSAAVDDEGVTTRRAYHCSFPAGDQVD